MRILVTAMIMVGVIFAETSPQDTNPGAGKGGLNPCLASCFLGPRVGLEMNEGKDIQAEEWIRFGGSLLAGKWPVGFVLANGYSSYMLGGKNNGMTGFFASFFIGPRVGQELGERKIRTKEWLLLVPCVNIYPAISIPLEAYKGKTMTEIEIAERLRKS